MIRKKDDSTEIVNEKNISLELGDLIRIQKECLQILKGGLLDLILKNLRDNIYKKFDSSKLEDTQTQLLLKTQLEGLRLIRKEIERFSKESLIKN